MVFSLGFHPPKQIFIFDFDSLLIVAMEVVCVVLKYIFKLDGCCNGD